MPRPFLRAGTRCRLGIVAVAAPLLAMSWALMWTQSSFWSPFFFFGTWVAAATLMYTASESGHPGWRRQLLLMLIAIPVWWWFELVNQGVGNWEYIRNHGYSRVQYALLASMAFSTVVPALDSAWRLTLWKFDTSRASWASPAPRGLMLAETAVGTLMLFLVFGFGDLLFPLVWVAPFLVFDGLVGYRGGRSLIQDLLAGEWRLPAAVTLAGIWCGLLWEFWNFWATPKWVYHIQYLGFLKVFEMPILGYLGYVPFAWSIYQLLALLRIQRDRWEVQAVADVDREMRAVPTRGLRDLA